MDFPSEVFESIRRWQSSTDSESLPWSSIDSPAGPLKITVDDRERKSGVIEHLQARPDIQVKVLRLHAGDYLVSNSVIIERKTLQDLLISLMDGRLFSQAAGLVESGHLPLLIIEGHIPKNHHPAVSRSAVQGAITTLALVFGISCLRSMNPSETALLIRIAGEQTRRQATQTIKRHGYKPKRKKRRRLFILQGLPGIGPVRARRLLDTLGSLEAVFSADVKTLGKVEGIGRETARAIRDLIEPDSV